MTYIGHVQNGSIILDEEAVLPEGIAVRVEIMDSAMDKPLHPEILRFSGVLPPDIDARSEYLESMRKKHQ